MIKFYNKIKFFYKYYFLKSYKNIYFIKNDKKELEIIKEEMKFLFTKQKNYSGGCEFQSSKFKFL